MKVVTRIAAAALGLILTPAYALVSQTPADFYTPPPAFTSVWDLVDNGGLADAQNNWLPYQLLDGTPIHDAEGGATNDSTNGGASFSASTDLASGWNDLTGLPNPGPCTATGDVQCGNSPTGYTYYYNGGADGDLSNDFLFLRMRVNGDPRAADGFVSEHFNFLLDTDGDGFKEFWVDLEGGGATASTASRLNILYEDIDQNTVTNADGAGTTTGNAQSATCVPATPPVGTVVDSFVACNTPGATTGVCSIDGEDRSFARAVQITDSVGAGPAGNTEWFVDVVVPVDALRANDGCYTNPDKLTDSEQQTEGTFVLDGDSTFRYRLSTSNSNTDPLQKDTADVDFSGTQFATLPVTLAYIRARQQGEHLQIDWSTASETSNVGFNLYAVEQGEWTKLNDAPIAGALDSLEPMHYSETLPLSVGGRLEGVGIAGIDVNGDEDRHGPYPLNDAVGSRPVAVAVNWGLARAQLNAALKERKVRPGSSVHMDIDHDGLYRVTDTELQAMGFDFEGVSGDHIAVSFRGDAVSRQIGGLDRKGRWAAGSWVEFLGEAPAGRDAIYLDAYRYQLSRDVSLVDAAAPFEVPKPGPAIEENNLRYAFSLPGEDPWYDAFFYARGVDRPASLTRNFDLPGLTGGEAEITVVVHAISEGAHHLLVELNGTEVADVHDSGAYKAWPITVAVADGVLKEKGNTLRLVLPGDASDFDYVVYDKLIVDYPNDLAGQVYTPALTLAEAVRRNELATGRADLIVITHPAFMGPVLDRYVEDKKSDGWFVKLVDVFEVYEAYGYGMATPSAIVDFLKDARKTGFDHVQLVGAASFDYRDFLGQGSVSFIPSVYTNTSQIINFTPCDACYVTDAEEIPLVAIGRWPVHTQQELDAVLNKGKQWESGLSGIGKALLIADQVVPGNDFVSQLEAAAQQLIASNGWDEPARVYLDEAIAEAGNVPDGVSAARSEIRASLDRGAGVTIFSGHGSPSTWSFSGLLRQQDIASLDNLEQPTLALPLTCYTTYAESPSTSTLAHQLLAAGENGAVGVFGAATLSEFWQNGALIREVLSGLLDGDTIGGAILAAKKNLGPSYRDVVLNSNLLGDVTLRLH